MICFQAIVWSLAAFKIARLIVLGIGGTLLALGWIVLRRGVERFFLIDIVPENFPVRAIAFTLLGFMGLTAFIVATIAVENQRRGGIRRWKTIPGIDRSASPVIKAVERRTLIERLDFLSRGRKQFKSAAAAQFWYEWRRHASLVPLATGCVLVLIMAPAPFLAPIGAERAGILLSWIFALPLLLALVLGKGFGKADLWSKEPGIPLFLATKPLSIEHWIGAKMKAAALASAVAWLIVLVATSVWLRLWCDYQPLLDEIRKATTAFPAFNVGSALALLSLCVLLTWRFLIGSLYLGLSGRAWMINVAACGVFLGTFAVPLGIAAIVEDHSYLLLYPPGWVAWLISGLFAAKLAGAGWLAGSARSRRLITTRAILFYLGAWIAAAAALVGIGFKLIPFEITRAAGWSRWTIALLLLLFVPLLRVAAAPAALARNRRR